MWINAFNPTTERRRFNLNFEIAKLFSWKTNNASHVLCERQTNKNIEEEKKNNFHRNWMESFFSHRMEWHRLRQSQFDKMIAIKKLCLFVTVTICARRLESFCFVATILRLSEFDARISISQRHATCWTVVAEHNSHALHASRFENTKSSCRLTVYWKLSTFWSIRSKSLEGAHRTR